MHQAKYIPVVLVLAIFACSSPNEKTCPQPDKEPIETQHGDLFKMYSTDDGYVLETQTSWQNQNTKSFVLSRDNQDCNNHIKIPVERVIVFTGSSIYMIDTLNALNSLVGFGNANYSGNKKLHNAIDKGNIKDVGDFSTADLEALIMLDPDLIIVSGTGSENPKIDRLEKAGIPVLENVEWMEKHPLGMAEWLKVVGLLYDELEVATDIYDDVASNYNRLKDSANQLPEGSRIIYDQNYGGTWYVPGQNSYIGTIYNDANIPYPYAANDASGSIVKDIEIILETHQDDTIWVSPGASSLTELADSDERHTFFKAFQMGNVFQYDKRQGVNGITLYWEERVLRCDWLLEDFINMSQHGGYAKGLHFYRKLAKQ